MDALKAKTIYWQKEYQIPGTPWTIRGYSRSAFRTGFYIAELDMMLDAGPQNFSRPKNILITHTHIDHIACLPFTMIGDTHSDLIFEIYGPENAKDHITNYIKAMFTTNAMDFSIDPREWYNYNGMVAGDSFNLNPCKGTNLVVEVFQCDHPIPTVSYGLSDVKNKLKDEYIGLPSKEIVELRKNGVQITKEVIQKRLAYVCDTSIQVLTDNPTILDYPVIFIECTFVLPDEIDNAVKTKHIHWGQLKPYVISHKEIQFVLFHFSQRYRDSELDDFFRNEMEQCNIKNIYWW